MVTGGYDDDGSLDSTELFDFTTGHWRTSVALPTTRNGLQAATLDNRVLVFG